MVFNLSDTPSIANQFIAELRDAGIQKDSLRFRRNLERIGELLAFEISKTFAYRTKEIETPLGIARMKLPTSRIVLGTIFRAGLPMHHGMLNYFDSAHNAFVSAYRRQHKDGSFEIKLEYISCPNLDDCVLIVCDPMLATGASMGTAVQAFLQNGTPAKIHIATVIAATSGLNHIRRLFPNASVWMGTLDEELTAKSYIVPGLGDAGDLAFGEKIWD
jgi:uracil phosphoribosyltransferase